MTRRSRFPVPATDAASAEACTIARPILRLILGVVAGAGSGDSGAVLRRRIEACLAELVAIAYTASSGDDLLCSVWVDADHVFLSVDHDQPLPRVPGDDAMSLSAVVSIADDYGSVVTDTGSQTWAAIRRH